MTLLMMLFLKCQEHEVNGATLIPNLGQAVGFDGVSPLCQWHKFSPSPGPNGTRDTIL